MTLSEELEYRGFVNQTTFKDNSELDKDPITFYWGVDPSADSMTVGHLALAMMVKHFIKHGHKAILLVGGATGLVGDPDGKSEERPTKTLDEIAHNKTAIAAQYQQVFSGQPFTVVDNYDWFKPITFLDFLRDIGKHVPMRQMLGREFIQSRLGEEGSGISYAEFSYSLIQGYDFLHLSREYGVSLQVCGSDQWGNSIAGVELLRRIDGKEAHVWSAPLVINKSTGVKFGKSEAGAVWLDPAKTSPTQFYQFWINVDDDSVESYLKLFTELDKAEIDSIMISQNADRGNRQAQTTLAREVTTLVHGSEATSKAQRVTDYMTGKLSIGDPEAPLDEIRANMPSLNVDSTASILEVLVRSGLASSNGDARRLIASNAISVNGERVAREQFVAEDFTNGRLLIRRGKAFKDTALIELQPA